MNNKQIFIFLMIFTCFLFACEQPTAESDKQERWIIENQLDVALRDSTGHNVIDHKRIIIQNEETAIQVAEPILFGLYGKQNILAEKPYKISNNRNYWIIEGSLPDGYKGGTFLIIIDSRNGEVIKITHGK